MIEIDIKVNGKRVGYLQATNIDKGQSGPFTGRFAADEMRKYRIESARKIAGRKAIDRNFEAFLARSPDPFQFTRDAINAVFDEAVWGHE